MSTLRYVEKWLSALGEQIGANLRMEDGICTLDREGRYQVVLQLDEKAATLHLWGALADLPTDVDIEEYTFFYEALLFSNFSLTETGGARFALDETKGRIILCNSIAVTPKGEQAFLEMIPQFMNAADFWHTRFNSTDE